MLFFGMACPAYMTQVTYISIVLCIYKVKYHPMA